EGPLFHTRLPLDDGPLALGRRGFPGKHRRPRAQTRARAAGLRRRVFVVCVNREAVRETKQPPGSYGKNPELGGNVGWRRRDDARRSTVTTAAEAAAAPAAARIAGPLVQHRGIQRIAVIGPLLRAVLAIDDRPFADW